MDGIHLLKKNNTIQAAFCTFAADGSPGNIYFIYFLEEYSFIRENKFKAFGEILVCSKIRLYINQFGFIFRKKKFSPNWEKTRK